MNERLRQLLDRLGQPRILVLGDLMLDRYVYGDAERISQEAPIQVLKIVQEAENRLGGAGAVANNLVALEAKVDLVGIVGRDEPGDLVRAMLRRTGVGTAGVRRVANRPTTIKTRFVGRAQHRIPQQVLRVDLEDDRPVDRATEAALLRAIAAGLRRANVLVISDYAKGVVTPGLCRRAIRAARQRGVPVLVDPIRSKDYAHYSGATLLTPNRVETEMAAQARISDAASLEAIAQQLIGQLNLDSLAITLDKEGAYLGLRGRAGLMIPTRPRNVFDNAGAGDMFISALALAMGELRPARAKSGAARKSGRFSATTDAAVAALAEAVALANVAGGLEVEKFGVQTVSREEIANDLMATNGKVRTRRQLVADLKRDRGNNLKIVFTNGCFDLLHHGHVQYLEFARSQGDRLVVGLNSDASVRRLKGPHRPLVPQSERARVLAGLTAVDYVVIFDEETPAELIRAAQPDVLIKGADWRAKGVVGRDTVEARGGKVILAPLVGQASTSDIIAKIRRADGFAPPITSKKPKARRAERL